MAADAFPGVLHVLLLYDVADEIHLDSVRSTLHLQPAGRGHALRGRAPEYVRFSRPPVVEPFTPANGLLSEAAAGSLKYYDYGVIGAELIVPFNASWHEVIQLTSRWIEETGFENDLETVIRQRTERIRSSLVKPYDAYLTEDYYVIEVPPIIGADGESMTAAELIDRYGPQIAQCVRGEPLLLSSDERTEILSGRLSYYPNDLVVAGWTAALVYDTPDGAAPSVELLEYANSQLLEFRHYDQVLTRVLEQVYQSLEKPRSFWSRWRMAREAEQLNTIRLEVQELTERMEYSIKFLSDMFSARLYRLAAARVGVPDYRALVDEKLRTAGELYHFLIEQYNHARAFVLESMIVLILIIDLFYLFRGKS